MSYPLDDFVADCRTALAAGKSTAALETIRQRLERLLGDADFVARHLGPDAAPGRETLHEDPDAGFMVYAHVQAKASIRPPHDHADAWAVYGQAAEHTRMTEWTLDPGAATPRAVKTYELTPGHAATFDVGALHSIDYPDGARFVRVTGGDLDGVEVRLFGDVDVRATVAEQLRE